MSKASSPPPWARIALTWASMISASRVCCAVNGIDACLLASQGIRHVLRDGFHSVHAMLSGMSHTKVLCRKAPAASRVSPFTLSRTRYHGSQQHLILDVHFISSLPVILRSACKAWVDRGPVPIVAAED